MSSNGNIENHRTRAAAERTGFLARDVDAGIASKRFPGIYHRVALDLVIGSLFSAAHSLAAEKLDECYPEAFVKAMPRGLGLNEKDAARIIAQPLPGLLLQDASIMKSARDTGNGGAWPGCVSPSIVMRRNAQ